MAASLKAVGAPAALVDQAEDTDYEGGHVASVLYDAWRNIEAEFESGDAPADAGAWADMVEYYVHDAVIDLADGLKGRVNAKELAVAVVQHMLTGKAKKVASVELTPESLMNAVKGAVKKAGIKLKARGRMSMKFRNFITVMADQQTTFKALEPTFTHLGFEVEGTSFIKHIGYTGEAEVTVNAPEEGDAPGTTEIYVSVNKGRGL